MIRNFSRIAVIPLVASLLLSGCYNWVPIERDFAKGEKRKFDQVRIGRSDTDILVDATVTWPELKGVRTHFVTMDLRNGPLELLKLSPAEMETLTDGRTIKRSKVRIGETVFRNASFTWPLLQGISTGPVVVDLSQTLAERQKMKPGAVVATAITLTLTGIVVVGLLAGATYTGVCWFGC